MRSMSALPTFPVNKQSVLIIARTNNSQDKEDNGIQRIYFFVLVIDGIFNKRPK